MILFMSSFRVFLKLDRESLEMSGNLEVCLERSGKYKCLVVNVLLPMIAVLLTVIFSSKEKV